MVVFESPYSFDEQLLTMRGDRALPSSLTCAIVGFPLMNFFTGIDDPACNAYIKRVVGIPGDNIVVNSKGKLFVNSQLIDEPYVEKYCAPLKNEFSFGRGQSN